jgi:hypothetical protein
MSLNDPLDEFLQSRGKLNSKISCNISLRAAEQMRQTLLWRQDPGDSFSDWKIVLEIDAANKEIVSVMNENKSDIDDNEELIAGDDQNKSTASTNNNHDGISNQSTETTLLTTTFYVHQCILASESTYFRSLLKKR